MKSLSCFQEFMQATRAASDMDLVHRFVAAKRRLERNSRWGCPHIQARNVKVLRDEIVKRIKSKRKI